MTNRSPFGVDFSSFVGGLPDLDPTFSLVEGDRNPLECVARRWLTPHGTLEGTTDDDAEFGCDVRQWLQQRGSATARARMKLALEAEARKEQRVRSCVVTITQTATGLKIVGTVETDRRAQYALTVSVTQFAALVAIEAL